MKSSQALLCALIFGQAVLSSNALSDSWSKYGGNEGHHRAVKDEVQITRSNVDNLRLLWEKKAPGVTCDPLVVDGVVYWVDWDGGVYANRLDNGREIWTARVGRGDKGGGSGTPALVDGYLYTVTHGGLVVKLDADDGRIIWRQQINAGPHIRIYSSPAIADGVLVIGVSGDGTSKDGIALDQKILDLWRGSVQGFDTETGKFLWEFETTRGPEGRLYAGGVSVWSSATIDRKRGLAYIGTGNSYNTPASPYSDSLLALDYHTGKLAWHIQFTEGDAFRSVTPSGGPDYDVGATPNLFTIDGRDLVGVGDKGSTYYVVDPDRQQVVWQRKLKNGSSLGGIMASAAYNDGIVYVSTNNGQIDLNYYIFAMEADTGRVLWDNETDGFKGIVPVTWANDVIFAGAGMFRISLGSLRPHISAYDARNGRLLWQEFMPAPVGGGVTIADGKLVVGYGLHFQSPTDWEGEGGLRVYGLR